MGYFEGRHHTKKWLTTDQDLVAMNTKFDEMTYYACAQQPAKDLRDWSPPHKKSSKRNNNQKEVDDIFQDL